MEVRSAKPACYTGCHTIGNLIHPCPVLLRTNFESRNCECLWLSAYQQHAPTIVPCSLPVNMTRAKSVFRGLGRVHGFVNDDTGAIISTGARYRSLLIANTSAFGTAQKRLRFYSLNLEHAESEANGEVRNASYVDIYSIKGEGNTPLLWVRAGGTSRNISVLAFGGNAVPFPFNFTQPPDFAQLSASMFRVDADARASTTLAVLMDHGNGANGDYWPPTGGTCTWTHHFPYPGEKLDHYPFGTWPNATMWNCWYGEHCSTKYTWMVSDGQGDAYEVANPGHSGHTAPMDKPALWQGY